MNARIELFIGQSKESCESLDWSQALEPDEIMVHRIVNYAKQQIEEIDELVLGGELDLGIAEQRRREIEELAWPEIKKRVLIRWASKDLLGPVRAKYRKAMYGEELKPDFEEAIYREKALRKFEAVSFEIATLHHVVF